MSFASIHLFCILVAVDCVDVHLFSEKLMDCDAGDRPMDAIDRPSRCGEFGLL